MLFWEGQTCSQNSINFVLPKLLNWNMTAIFEGWNPENQSDIHQLRHFLVSQVLLACFVIIFTDLNHADFPTKQLRK